MNFFVTGVGGQLGHDVMNELLKRGHEGVGSDRNSKVSKKNTRLVERIRKSSRSGGHFIP